MSDSQTLTILSKVLVSEEPALTSAAQQLCMHLRKCGLAVTVNIRPLEAIHAVPVQGNAVAVLSMLTELGQAAEPMAQTFARWLKLITELQRGGIACMVCTIFRCAPSQLFGETAAVTERILRLNLMAIELSHATGVGVADIDRALAEVGAQPLQTNSLIGHGGAAAALAGHTLVRTLLTEGLAEQLPAELLEQALNSAGSLHAFIRHALIPHHLT